MCKATLMFPSFFSNWQFETVGPFSINESDEPKAEFTKFNLDGSKIEEVEI